jgi:hypothetical protein
MTDKTDIVARLRAYTRHDRPVLSSDLKEAADELEKLRRDLTAGRGYDGGDFVPFNLNNAVRVRLTEKGQAKLAQAGVSATRDGGWYRMQMHALMEAFGPIKWAMHDYISMQCEVEAERLQEPEQSDAAARPGEPHPASGLAKRMNDLDARIARLESSVRLTERRLMLAAASLYDSVRKDPTPRSVANRIHDALVATSEDRFADYGVPK